MNRATDGAWPRARRATALLASRQVFQSSWSLIIALALATLAITACKTAPKTLPPEPAPVASNAPPGWVRQSLSWEKLEALEQWLENDSQRHDPGLVVEAELQLNEGRLVFAQRDLDHKSVPNETLRVRVESAKDGFTKVLANPSASPGQRARAQIGQRGATALLGAPSAPTGNLTIITRAQWGAKAARTDSMKAMQGQWSRITVHHSDEETSDPDGGTLEEAMQTIRSIQRYHMEDAGHRWGDIGYHFMIDAAGRIYEARALQWQGAHAGDTNNVQNIGICLLGDLERRPPKPAALKSLELLLNDLRQRFRIPASRVYGHSELKSSTVCPGQTMLAWIRKYRG